MVGTVPSSELGPLALRGNGKYALSCCLWVTTQSAVQPAARTLARPHLPRRLVGGAAQQRLLHVHQLAAADGAVGHYAPAASGNLCVRQESMMLVRHMTKCGAE